MANAETELPLLAARLKAAGAVGLRTEMVAGLRAVAKPMVPLLQQSARDALPKKGGLNTFVADKKIKVSVRTTGRRAGVRIQSQNKGNYTNQGTWRHPVFGDRKKWVTETYEPAARWWDKTIEAHGDEAKAAATEVLRAVGRQAMGRGI
jgi:hypothetical protein